MDNKHTLPPYLFPLERDGKFSILEFDPESKEIWPGLGDVFSKYNIKMPLIFNDPAYQLESLFFILCRNFSVPSLAGNIYNLPVTREIIRATRPDLIVSNPEVIESLLNDLEVHEIEKTFTTVFLYSQRLPKELPELEKKFPYIKFIYDKHPLV
jgi:hypothetical protein